MHTTGWLAPASPADAHDTYEELGPTAQIVVKEVTKAMAFDADEYEERVTGAVVETARDAVFASLLSVTVGSRREYEGWCEDFAGEVFEAGSDAVDNVAWHAFDGRAVAATFQDERDAAIGTLRRQAFNRLYRELFYDE